MRWRINIESDNESCDRNCAASASCTQTAEHNGRYQPQSVFNEVSCRRLFTNAMTIFAINVGGVLLPPLPPPCCRPRLDDAATWWFHTSSTWLVALMLKSLATAALPVAHDASTQGFHTLTLLTARNTGGIRVIICRKPLHI